MPARTPRAHVGLPIAIGPIGTESPRGEHGGRPIAACGAIACAIAFLILTAQSARQDPTSLIVLVVLLLGVLIAEHGVLKQRRPIAPSTR